MPGCWTRQGTTDRPHYTNVLMPFRNEPPHLPARNPTGVYEREFELPEAWAGRRVVLHVGAAESVVIVELNGARVGVGKVQIMHDIASRLDDEDIEAVSSYVQGLK